jgi:voltage-gated potassium channel
MAPDGEGSPFRIRFLRRGYERFQSNPASARYAIAAIIGATVAVVVMGALLMWIFDHNSYPSFGGALWFTLQTVTTVGYGDTTPTSGVGRFVASVVMLTGIGLITVVTAAVTSVFIEAARVRAARHKAVEPADEPDPFARLHESLAAIAERLERLEAHRADETSDTA